MTRKTQRLLVALIVINLGFLTFQPARPRLSFSQGSMPVLRGRALEIVDERCKVRAQLRGFPADPKHELSNRDLYSETVLLRLVAEHVGELGARRSDRPKHRRASLRASVSSDRRARVFWAIQRAARLALGPGERQCRGHDR